MVDLRKTIDADERCPNNTTHRHGPNTVKRNLVPAAVPAVQDLRAPTGRSAAALVLAKRSSDDTTVVLAQSVNEALRLFRDANRWPHRIVEVGRSASFQSATLKAIARDRIQLETEFL